MGKRLIVSIVGATAVLASAAYVFIRSEPQPAAHLQVSANSAAAHPAQPLPPTAVPAANPVETQAGLPAHSPSLVAAVHRRATRLAPGTGSAPHIQPAVAYTSPPGASSTAAQQPLALSQSGGAEANHSATGPDLATLNGAPLPDQPSTASTVPSAAASAVLLPHGLVSLNGKSTADSAALFPGDRLEVPAGSYASINAKGALDVLQPGSSTVFTGQGLTLQRGGVAVSTSDGMPVQSEGLTISPQAGNGKYDVLDDNGMVHIAALHGALNITDGGPTTVLPEGQQTTRDRRKAAAAPPSSDTPNPVQTTPAPATGGFPTGKVLIISGVAGGGALAAILLTRSSARPTSPAAP